MFVIVQICRQVKFTVNSMNLDGQEDIDYAWIGRIIS